MKIVIMGCGRVGARLAQLFSADGHEVSVADLHAEAFARLGPEFRGHTQTGTGIDEDVLKLTGIEGADLFIAVTDHDNANIMAAQIAKLRFGVPRAIARIYEPDREETFHRLGLETICPTTLVSNRIYKAVTTGAGARIAPVQPPTPATTPQEPPEAPEPSEPSTPAARQETNRHRGLTPLFPRRT
ncbi:MAG: potassium channel family protein [Chloroflexia bacterium]